MAKSIEVRASKARLAGILLLGGVVVGPSVWLLRRISEPPLLELIPIIVVLLGAAGVVAVMANQKPALVDADGTVIGREKWGRLMRVPPDRLDVGRSGQFGPLKRVRIVPVDGQRILLGLLYARRDREAAAAALQAVPQQPPPPAPRDDGLELHSSIPRAIAVMLVPGFPLVLWFWLLAPWTDAPLRVLLPAVLIPFGILGAAAGTTNRDSVLVDADGTVIGREKWGRLMRVPPDRLDVGRSGQFGPFKRVRIVSVDGQRILLGLLYARRDREAAAAALQAAAEPSPPQSS